MNIGELLIKAYEELKCEHIDTYMLDSQLLLQKVLNKDKMYLILNRDVSVEEKQANEYLKLIDMRKNKMPVKYILGECEFMGMEFNVREGVLIPRGDTEILVESAIEKIKENNYLNICDVCCGSGAIGVSIGEFIKNSKVDCYDIEDVACEVTQENINKFSLENKVNVYKSDLLSHAIKEKRKFDMILSNPPYIRLDVIPTLMQDVRQYEPFIALCGGESGLVFYEKIIEQSLEVLKPGGMIGFEIGYDQREDVKRLLEEKGYEEIICRKDLAGLDRVVMGKLRM